MLLREAFCSGEIKPRDNRRRDNAPVAETPRRTVLEPGRADERTAPACSGHVPLQPNYTATNELPIRRIYCLVLSQELIKPTQLKAAVREASAASGPSIRLIHDCQLK